MQPAESPSSPPTASVHLTAEKQHRSTTAHRLPPCRVCGEPAKGFHYGVNTCEACKGFFQRSIRRKEPYQCIFEAAYGTFPAASVATGVTWTSQLSANGSRKACPHCRYQKCLEAGMSVARIKIGRYTYKKRTQDIIERRYHDMMRHFRPNLHIPIRPFDVGSREPCLQRQKRPLRSPQRILDRRFDDQLRVQQKADSFRLHEDEGNYQKMEDTSFLKESEEDFVLSKRAPLTQREAKWGGSDSDLSDDESDAMTEQELLHLIRRVVNAEFDKQSSDMFNDDNRLQSLEFFLRFKMNFRKWGFNDVAVPDPEPNMFAEDNEGISQNPYRTEQRCRPEMKSAYDSSISVWRSSVRHPHNDFRYSCSLPETPLTNARRDSGSCGSFLSPPDVDHMHSQGTLLTLETIRSWSKFSGDIKSAHLATKGRLIESPEDMIGQEAELSPAMTSLMTAAIERGVVGIIEFARRLPGFRSLPIDDQISLIKRSVFEVWLLSRYRAFDCQLRQYTTPGGITFNLEEAVGIDLADTLISVAHRLQSLHLSAEQSVLVKAFIIHFTDGIELQRPEMIDTLQNRLQRALEYTFVRQMDFDNEIGRPRLQSSTTFVEPLQLTTDSGCGTDKSPSPPVMNNFGLDSKFTFARFVAAIVELREVYNAFDRFGQRLAVLGVLPATYSSTTREEGETEPADAKGLNSQLVWDFFTQW